MSKAIQHFRRRALHGFYRYMLNPVSDHAKRPWSIPVRTEQSFERKYLELIKDCPTNTGGLFWQKKNFEFYLNQKKHGFI